MQYLKILTLVVILKCTLHAPCATNYYSNNDTCLPCDPKCDQCTGSSSNCTSCQQKYYLQNTFCYSCPQICASCTSNLVCTSCAQGYFLQNSKCAGCSSNCATCNSTTVCASCKVGYDILYNCRTCAKSFFWNQTRKGCDRCALGCFQCTSTLYCQSCNQFYTYQSGVCIYTGSQSESLSPLPSDKAKNIIIGIIVGGVLMIGLIFYIAYRFCFKKQKPKLKQKIKNMSSNAKIVQSQSMSIEDQTSSINIQNCIYCNKSKAQKRLRCGHYVEHSCLQQSQEQWCSICDLKPEQKSVYLDEMMENNSQVENSSQMNSQTTSQQPKNNAYMQSQMKESQMMDNIIQIEQQQQ